MKKILLTLLFAIQIFASEVYLLPDDSDGAKEKISALIKDAKESIFFSIYTFSYKKIAKDLIEAHKNGVKVTVLFEKEKIKEDKTIYNMLIKNGIKTITLNDKRKMHLKAMLIDDSIAIIGSANYTKKSFEENIDLIYVTQDEKLISKLKEFRAKFD